MDVRLLTSPLLRPLSLMAIALTWCMSANSLFAQEPTTSPPQAGAAVSTTAAAPRVVDYNNPTLEDILTAWREREEKVKNYELVWDERCENHCPQPIDEYGNNLQVKVDVPVITVSTDNRLIATHDSMHYKWHQAADLPNPDSAPPSFSITRMNRDGCGVFDDSARLKGTFGRIKPSEIVKNDLSMAIMLPMLALYRPLWQTCAAVQPLSAHEANGVIIRLLDFRDADNRPLIEIVQPPRRNRFSVKSAPGFPPERIEGYIDLFPDRPSTPCITTIELEEHPVAGWIPRLWSVRTVVDRASGAQLMKVRTGTLTSAQFNVDFPARTFDPTFFPAETLVSDERNPDGKGILYKSDGSALITYDPRPKSAQSEGNSSDNQRTNKGGVFNREPWGFAQYAVVVNSTLFCLLFGIWFWRRRNQQ